MNQKLLENNFLIIKNFITKERAKKLHKKFKKYCEGNNASYDNQVPNTPAKYNYLPFLELLCEKTPNVSKFVGENVLPTYCYSRLYKNGDILEKHTDRDSCEISLSIHLDSDEEWEIYIETPTKQEVSVKLSNGDALLYFGCDAPHWRKEYNGSFYSQVFLHYVISEGKKSSNYFDNNKNVLEDYITIFDNLIPSDFCDFILQEYKDSEEWSSAQVRGEKILKKVRNCEIINISHKNTISKNYSIRNEIDSKLYNYASIIIKNLAQKYRNLSISCDSGYGFLKYETNGFYIQHTDSFTDEPRTISCSICLNDNYEGGEFAFFDRKLKYKLKKGSVITFPSNFMYPHEIMPVTKGTRYSIITWFN